MIRASDGLDYENLTARLTGQPAQTPHNNWVSHLRITPGEEEALGRILSLPADADRALCTSTFVGSQALRAGKSILAGKSPRTAITDDLQAARFAYCASVAAAGGAAGAGSTGPGQA